MIFGTRLILQTYNYYLFINYLKIKSCVQPP